MKAFVAQSLGMINYLCQHGHLITKLEDSTKDPTKQRKVAVFEYTPQLDHDIKQYTKLRKEY